MGRKKSRNKPFSTKYKIEKENYGQGGNAHVHICSLINDSSKEVALKELQNCSDEKKIRFRDEIQIMEKNYKLIDGILPILDSSIDEYWYTMPIATLITDYIKKKGSDIAVITDGVLDLTDTLIHLHKKGISHRDIKPSNIYYYNNRYCLGDFGLVDHPDNPHNCTKSDKGLGAIFTIAPEMKRNPKAADGKKADVYSLAKTLWMLLTLDEKGFDGPYDFLDKSYSLNLNSKYRKVHLVELEELLFNSTMNLPKDRPSMEGFKEKLLEWREIYRNEEKAQLSDWNFLQNYLFKGTTPESTTWSKVDDIVEILNIIGRIPAYNHMLFSDKGGLDFEAADKATEKDCIYIYASNICYIIKPKRLYFAGFKNFIWNYFLLELDELSPVFDEQNTEHEELVEDLHGNYVSAQYGVYDYSKGDKLPEGFKIVYRYLKGKFLIILKSAPYNEITSTYDGRHGDCSNDKFREYIESLISIVKEKKEKGYSHEEILSHKCFHKNPFKEKEKTSTFADSKTTKPSSYKSILENYKQWSFSDVIDTLSTQGKNNIIFYFKFEEALSSISCKNKIYLSKDLTLKEILCTNYSDMYTCSSRDIAIKIEQKLNDRIKELCEIEDYDCHKYSPFYFSINFAKTGKPTHLFAKEEIRDLLKKVDDRHKNQLVIDENGYAKLLVESNDGQLYPVYDKNEIAGKICVGKDLSLEHLDKIYISLLKDWLCYLETGHNIYKKYIDNKYSERELIQKIKNYY